MLEKLSLDGRVAMVTGGGGGLGTAISLALAEAGADIIVTDFRPEAGEHTAAEVIALGRKAVFLPADVTKSVEVNSMMAKAISQWGRVDILVNGAGIVRGEPEGDVTRKPLWEITDHDWHLGIDTNLTGAFFCSRAVTKHMVERGYGKIINISSGFGLRGRRNSFMYCAAKAGVIGLTFSLSLTIARYGIRVNAIAPGLYHTLATEEMYETAAKFTPMGRAGEPREVRELAVYLASNASDYVTGEVYITDGGALAGGAAPTGYAPIITI